MRIARLLFSISLLSLAVVSWGSLAEAAAKMDRAATASQVEKVYKEYERYVPARERQRLKEALKEGEWGKVRSWFIGARSVAELARQEKPAFQVDPGAAAREILRDPRFTDPAEPKKGNWLQESLQAMARQVSEFLANLLRILFGWGQNAAAAGAFRGIPGGEVMVKAVVVILVLIAVGAAVFFLLRSGAIRRRRKAAAGGLLDEGEEERTADQWLVEADRLEAQGLHREAVRCLYLASLLRLDELGFLRFRRWETNWEHLARFESSASRPPLDLRGGTKRFDLVWYGFKVKGAEDTAALRSFYLQVLALKPEAAA